MMTTRRIICFKYSITQYSYEECKKMLLDFLNDEYQERTKWKEQLVMGMTFQEIARGESIEVARVQHLVYRTPILQREIASVTDDKFQIATINKALKLCILPKSERALEYIPNVGFFEATSDLPPFQTKVGDLNYLISAVEARRFYYKHDNYCFSYSTDNFSYLLRDVIPKHDKLVCENIDKFFAKYPQGKAMLVCK